MAVPSRSEIPVNTTLIQEEQPDLRTITSIPITESIPDAILEKALKTNPFIPIPGALNLRDIGLIPGPKIKPGLLYRSGSLHVLPPSSVLLLKTELNLSTVYDFRSVSERGRAPSPEIPGVEQIWLPASEAGSPTVPADFKDNGGVEAYKNMYDDLLKVYAASYKTVLEGLRDRPGSPVLFHCSGKPGPSCSRLTYLTS
jgi:hypothetical protein